VGTERLSALLAYDLDAWPGRARFAGYINTRPADLGPEGIHFVCAKGSPTRRPLLLTANEATGTVAAFEIRLRR
jgi:2',3'-cyclic-nucleotide 2'-phosphodiesterase / 3'-nucleotidase / 5'-nucleotidase